MSRPRPRSLSIFEEEVRGVLAASHTGADIVEGVRPALRRLLASDEVLPVEWRKPLTHKYGQYLLYQPKDEAFSLIAFVWGPGQAAPIHDHLVWGVIGVFQGEIEETRYKLVGPGDTEHAPLEPVETVSAAVGDISHVYPPSRDIHRVSNPSSSVTAITLHVYGADIGTRERHIYDPATGRPSTVVTRHDHDEAIFH
ncbi:MAG: cysteine dioxygenase family protein [Kyrpidia sp.]|nr:cysteine dioxygenase family protein [Kyrpidia sp.]